jgi:cytochrome bd-type quinol oxidase subunit 2
MWVAYPVSATACFVTLRRWVAWMPAAFLGGLFYGFSPYMVAQGISHPNLFFVPIPPLILLVLDELFVRQRRSSRRVGIGLGLLAAAQYMISTEIFASTCVFAGFGLVLLMLLHRRQIRSRATHALEGLGWAVLVCGAIVGYSVYLAVDGPDRLADVAAHVYSSSSDLLSLVIPDANQRFAPSAWTTLGNQFAPGNLAENDGYLGIPLLMLLLVAAVRYRRRGVVAFAGLLLLLAEIMSLGPRLNVDAHTTSVPLLMADFDRLPIFSNFVDSRFALYADLFAAVVLAISVDQLRRTLRDRAFERELTVGRHQRPTPIRWPGFVVVVIVALALIPLVPRWPSRSYAASSPAYFSTEALERVPPGSVALTYPYPDYPNLSGMVWQAGTSMRFRIIGGYALVPGVDGQPIFRLFPPISRRSLPVWLMTTSGVRLVQRRRRRRRCAPSWFTTESRPFSARRWELTRRLRTPSSPPPWGRHPPRSAQWKSGTTWQKERQDHIRHDGYHSCDEVLGLRWWHRRWWSARDESWNPGLRIHQSID